MPWVDKNLPKRIDITCGDLSFHVTPLLSNVAEKSPGVIVVVKGDLPALSEALQTLEKIGVDISVADTSTIKSKRGKRVSGEDDDAFGTHYAIIPGLFDTSPGDEAQIPTGGVGFGDDDLQSRDQLVSAVEPERRFRIAGVIENDCAHETSPSVVGGSSPTVGDRQDLGAMEDAPKSDAAGGAA